MELALESRGEAPMVQRSAELPIATQGNESSGSDHLMELVVEDSNVKTAAKAAGINTVTLYRLLKRRGLHLGRTVRPD